MSLPDRLSHAHTRFERIRLALEQASVTGGWPSRIYEFLLFGFKQAWACLFGALLLTLLLATHLLYPEEAPLARYDFLAIAALAIQAGLLFLRLETFDEARVIFAFHLVGTAMELFKTAYGSWIYPEPSLLRIGGVPLFSGFMYAAVGSYIARIWRIFDIRFSHYPPLWTTLVLAAAIYANFFTHHWLPDARVPLLVATLLLFRRSLFWYRPFRKMRWMPVPVGFLLVALLIWIAENLATFSRAWVYPHQAHGWTPVSAEKLVAWYLLMIISFVLVSLVHRPRAYAPEEEASRERLAGTRGLA